MRQQQMQMPQPRPLLGPGLYQSNQYGAPMQPMATGYAGFQSQAGGFLQGGIDPK